MNLNDPSQKLNLENQYQYTNLTKGLMKAENVKQRSQDWHEIRRGRFTASGLYALMGQKFGSDLDDWTVTAQGYIIEKVAESFSTEDHEPSTKETRWGIEHEPTALAHYEAVFETEIDEIGFVLWSELPQCGCSPDGIVKNERGIEIKCPYTLRRHAEHLLIRSNEQLKKQRPQYYYQIMSSMMFTGYNRWDFVSFHPFFKPEHRLSCVEITADYKEFEYMAVRLRAAVELLDKLINEFKEQ